MMMTFTAILLVALIGLASASPAYYTTPAPYEAETTTGYAEGYETTTGGYAAKAYEAKDGKSTVAPPPPAAGGGAVPVVPPPVGPIGPISLFHPLPVLQPFGVSPLLFNPIRQLLPFGPFGAFGPFFGRKKRSVDAMKMVKSSEEKVEEIEEETPVKCWYKESKIECFGQEKPISCAVEQRLDIISDLKSIRLPSLIMEPEMIPTGVASKTTQVIDLVSQRSMMQWTLIHPKRTGEKSQVMLSIFSADIERAGFYVKEPECFDKITRVINENGIRGVKFSLVVKQD